MKRLLANRIARLRDDESGNASVEFVVVFPLFLMMMIMSIELGFITLRATLLERGLDMAVREIRLGTGEPSNHTEIKEFVCDKAGFLLNCERDLQLEMVKVDLRAYTNALEAETQCTDLSEPVTPPGEDTENFTDGVPNELMVLRACYKYDPIFPSAVLGSALEKDSNGQAKIVTISAFVQEPT